MWGAGSRQSENSAGFETSPSLKRILALSIKKSNSRQKSKSAASVTLMSTPPKPPERLAEILQEILALSDPTRTSQSESGSGSGSSELSDANCIEEEAQRREVEDNSRRRS